MKDMTIPLRIMHIISDGKFHSGEELGHLLEMSRSGINKHIKTIRNVLGIIVISVPGKGYSLIEKMELLNKKKILKQLSDTDKIGRIELIPIVDSTNQYLLDRINILKSGDVCIAEYQKNGRGRRGKKWISPFGVNLYLSIYWKLEQSTSSVIGLSLITGIVLVEVLNDLGVSNIKLKWPNDLYLNEKKLAGILIELIGKIGDILHIVIGIGINLYMKKQSLDLFKSNIDNWISVEEVGIKIDRNKLVAYFLEKLIVALKIFENHGLLPFMKKWKKLDYFINKHIKLIIGKKILYGIVQGINSQGALLLKSNGKIYTFISGEISLRKI